MLFAYCDRLDLSRLTIDALILPMRDLMSAAESRVHQERIARTETSLRVPGDAQVVGHTTGGVLYSLDVVDEARILGVGFHKLLHWAVVNELPVFLPGFPRMAEDRDYLLAVLWPWLGEHCTIEDARRAFSSTASVDAVRIRPSAAPSDPSAMVLTRGEPDPVAIDRAALVERIEELVDGQPRVTARLESRAIVAERERDELTETLERLTAELAAAEQQLEQVYQTAGWRLRDRLAQHRWSYGFARRIARILAP
jgi:hypothetical protein